MQNYHLIQRLELLLQVLQQHPHLSKQSLLAHLETHYELYITPRTLERDFKALDTKFGIEVCYDRSENSYYLNQADQAQILSFLQFTGRIYLGELLREGLETFTDLKQHICLEDNSNFSGIHQIKPILLAIKSRLLISFSHYNFKKNRHTTYQITPLQLKEYQGRWYVIGVPEGEDHIWTFGLDRISKLNTHGLSELPDAPYKSQLEKFKTIVGLNYNAAEERESIKLAFSKAQYRYIKTLPLHPSQRDEGTLPDGRFKISLFVRPTYALMMEILKLGKEVEVLTPASLREEISETLSEALRYYQ